MTVLQQTLLPCPWPHQSRSALQHTAQLGASANQLLNSSSSTHAAQGGQLGRVLHRA